MNNEIYRDNINALRNKYPAWANIIEKKRKQRNFDVIVEKSYTGYEILKVKQKEKIRYLNGKYAPEAVVEEWLNKNGRIEEYSPIVIVTYQKNYG